MEAPFVAWVIARRNHARKRTATRRFFDRGITQGDAAAYNTLLLLHFFVWTGSCILVGKIPRQGVTRMSQEYGGHTRTKHMLNLGCGMTHHADWVNVDYVSHDESVLSYDLWLGVPFADETFDVVYHSHVLEHFPRRQGMFFLSECYRVLRPGGLLRVAVPDLENITRAYLTELEAARRNEAGAENRHEWMLIEMLDQLTRDRSEGDMGDYWRRADLPEETFIRQRCGTEFVLFRERDTRRVSGREPLPETPFQRQGDANFARSGETHRWMYDEVSLAGTLRRLGFANIRRRPHNESDDPDVAAYGLDASPDGTVRKPESIFMEARKPFFGRENEDERIHVAVFSTHDSGGAGIAARRLHEGGLALGEASEFFVADLRTPARHVHILPAKYIICNDSDKSYVKSAWLLFAVRGQARIRKEYPRRDFSGETFTGGECVQELGEMPFTEEFDILHLHWIANFLALPSSPAVLKDKPIVWTLHDMRPFTGGCHYADGCGRFTEQCGACPQLGSEDERDASFDTWREQMGRYRKRNLHIVAPSRWLAGQAKKSSLFRRFPVTVIENGHPLDVFKPLDRHALREAAGIGRNDLVLGFSAENLGNKRKGMEYLLACLEELGAGPMRNDIRLMLLGDNPPGEFTACGLRADAVGNVTDRTTMAGYYNMMDALMVPSLEDNMPNVIAEAAGCGTPSIAFEAGGIAEMIAHGQTGWLAPVKDVPGLVQRVAALRETGDGGAVRDTCRKTALARWDVREQARKYQKLFEGILHKEG
ncbi:MAG: glycosyltransferase [Deltaproteobacteria bacterium]|nr:glycosyltransferase [Deltaproteobacteria bacterium]